MVYKRISDLDECDLEEKLEGSLIPPIILFISQLISGIGGSLYYSLGCTYIDDNIKKTKSPLIIGKSLQSKLFHIRNVKYKKLIIYLICKTCRDSKITIDFFLIKQSTTMYNIIHSIINDISQVFHSS